MTGRILIVDDEEPLTLLLRYNLEAEGYSVETAMRGDEADLKLKENTPDLAVIDWMLPGLSGIDLIRRLRARPDTNQLPIIMLTARREESERVRGLTTGATTTSSSRSRCPSCWRGFAPCCAGPSRNGSPACCRQATSSLTARRSGSRAPAATCRSARPNSACSNS